MLRDELLKFVSEKENIKNQFKSIGFSNKNPKFDNSSNKSASITSLRKSKNSMMK